eukprot:scaffold10159_cov63-Phaeocystis_antarctica.AAC.4
MSSFYFETVVVFFLFSSSSSSSCLPPGPALQDDVLFPSLFTFASCRHSTCAASSSQQQQPDERNMPCPSWPPPTLKYLELNLLASLAHPADARGDGDAHEQHRANRHAGDDAGQGAVGSERVVVQPAKDVAGAHKGSDDTCAGERDGALLQVADAPNLRDLRIDLAPVGVCAQLVGHLAALDHRVLEQVRGCEASEHQLVGRDRIEDLLGALGPELGTQRQERGP